MANPSKMLEIFIIFCYFIHYSHSGIIYSAPVQDCINLMVRYELIKETILYNSTLIESIYENLNFPISEIMLTTLKRMKLDEPLNTYIKNYSIKNPSQEDPLAFCQRQ
uniref:Uncharacterized protein n=1 Tax=Schizaphis graminum TaxID=13262 RepID=A0A2S2PGI9_SCHGA